MFCTSCGNELADGSKFCNNCGASTSSNTEPNTKEVKDTENTVSGDFVLASFGQRLVAFIIDIIILTMFLVVIVFMLVFEEDQMSESTPQIIGTFLLTAYFVILESSSLSATFGKKIMGIYVITENGDKLSIGKAIIRNLARQLSSIFFIGYIMALFTEKTQTLHDKIAKTLVVKR